MTTEQEQFAITTRPVAGASFTSETSVPQKSAEEFLAAIDAILAIKGVKAVVWRQYTPYFNDGDPCEFNVHDFGVRLSGRFNIGEEDGDWEDGVLTGSDLYTYKSSRPDWNDREAMNAFYSESNRLYKLNGQDTQEIADALAAVKVQEFEAVCKSNFGDHAIVTATKEGFNVEEYSHD